MHELSHAQSELILVYNFFDGLNGDSTLPQETKNLLWLNFRLFALHTINKSNRQFSRCGAVREEDLDELPDRILQLMQEIRPHAVRLVDSWSIPDYLLDRLVTLASWLKYFLTFMSLVLWDDLMAGFMRTFSTEPIA
jgi:acyl-CoA oxidase